MLTEVCVGGHSAVLVRVEECVCLFYAVAAVAVVSRCTWVLFVLCGDNVTMHRQWAGVTAQLCVQ